MSLHLKTYEQLAKLKYLSILVNALAAAGDVLIAATLCILLHQSRTGFKRSDTMINKLILFSVNTGVLTRFVLIVLLYTNSLLATLNARRKIRDAGEVINSTSENLSFSMRNVPLAARRPTNISIKIDTTKEFATDHDSDRGPDTSDLEKAEMPSSSVMQFEEKERQEV
uniref:DUF6534 domain-containing protein n=1 Tax=Psilocybe cubensis TaxID=181762 RepID=A0A8H7XRG0_PSICU